MTPDRYVVRRLFWFPLFVVVEQVVGTGEHWRKGPYELLLRRGVHPAEDGDGVRGVGESAMTDQTDEDATIESGHKHRTFNELVLGGVRRCPYCGRTRHAKPVPPSG